METATGMFDYIVTVISGESYTCEVFLAFSNVETLSILFFLVLFIKCYT